MCACQLLSNNCPCKRSRLVSCSLCYARMQHSIVQVCGATNVLTCQAWPCLLTAPRFQKLEKHKRATPPHLQRLQRCRSVHCCIICLCSATCCNICVATKTCSHVDLNPLTCCTLSYTVLSVHIAAINEAADVTRSSDSQPHIAFTPLRLWSSSLMYKPNLYLRREPPLLLPACWAAAVGFCLLDPGACLPANACNVA